MTAAAVHDLELDLDAFEGPFDLLLTVLLKEELEPAEIDMAAIVVAFVERLAERASRPSPAMPSAPPDVAGGTVPSGAVQSTVPSGPAPPATPEGREVHELDLEACGEFLVLIASLLELKARALFPDEEAELAELEPEEAAEELARRLAEYRRMKEAATWLAERLAGQRDRYFRVGAAPLAPRPERKLAAQDPEQLAVALRALSEPPAQVSLAHMTLRFPPVSQFLERFRAVLRRRRRFDFDAEVGALPRIDQAVAFLALLELRKVDEIALEQAGPFSPIRVSRPAARPWPATAPAGRSPAPPPPDAAGGAPADGPYSHTVPPAYAPPAAPQERADERGQETENPSERNSEWIARSA